MPDESKPQIPECCQDPANLMPYYILGNQNPDASAVICRVCHRKHYGLKAQPLDFTAKIKPQ